jgi:hypothetical protein
MRDAKSEALEMEASARMSTEQRPVRQNMDSRLRPMSERASRTLSHCAIENRRIDLSMKQRRSTTHARRTAVHKRKAKAVSRTPLAHRAGDCREPGCTQVALFLAACAFGAHI